MTNSRSKLVRRLRIAGATSVITVVAAGSLAACGSSDSTNDSPREITSVGVGESSGKPDVLTVQMSVQHQAGDVSTALNEASAKSQKVIDAAVANGVEKSQISTANVKLNPRYGRDSEITSYEATQSLTIKVRKLDTASKLLGDLTTAGGDATRIDSVGFDIENDDELKASARDKAFAEAKTRAEQYATLSGGKLGEVRTVSEVPVATKPSAREFGASAAPDTAASPVPIETGEQSLKVTVTVVWQLS